MKVLKSKTIIRIKVVEFLLVLIKLIQKILILFVIKATVLINKKPLKLIRRTKLETSTTIVKLKINDKKRFVHIANTNN